MLTINDRIEARWRQILDEELARLTDHVCNGMGIPDIEVYRRKVGHIAGLRQAIDIWDVAKQDIARER